jgi:flagellar basal-body rod protein FlgG
MNLALWSAKTGLDSQNTQMAIISNNLANANTTGYKSQRAAFQDLMYQNVRQVGAQSTQNTQYSTGLTLGTGVRIVATEANYSQGSSTTTNNPLDLQISGQGFFQITMPDGSLAYTRDGSFTLDNQGNVVTASGYPIQPAITIPVGTQSVTVGSDGAVTAVSAAGKTTQIGQVQLADFINDAGSAEHRQQPRHRVRGERLAADGHRRVQRPRHHSAGLARDLERQHGDRAREHDRVPAGL